MFFDSVKEINRLIKEISNLLNKGILYLSFCLKQIFFNILALSQCIVYWIYFQNIHTFSYQKTLLHTLFCFIFKIVEAFSVYPQECIITIMYSFKFLNKIFLKNKIHAVWMIDWLINKYKTSSINVLGRWFTLDKFLPSTSEIRANKKNNKAPCLYNQTYYDYRKSPFSIKYYDGDQ